METFFDPDDIKTEAVAETPLKNSGPVNVTFLSIPRSEDGLILSGFAKRMVAEADVVFANCFQGHLIDLANSNGAKEVISLSTYRNLSSVDERALFDLTSAEIAKVATSLKDIKVSKVEIGSCWAIGLRASIFRELYAQHTFNNILKSSHKNILVLLPGTGASDLALLTRILTIEKQGVVKIGGMCELKDDTLRPLQTDSIDRIRSKLGKRDSERDYVVAPATTERIVGLPKAILGARPTEADVLFMHLTDNLMFQNNVEPVLKSVKDQGGKPAVLVVSGKAIDVYKDNLPAEKIHRFDPRAEWEDAEILQRLAEQIRTRLEVSALSANGIETWTPLFAASFDTRLTAKIRSLMVFQSAMHLVRGWVKPKSIYLTQSPDSNAYAYLSLLASRGLTNFYYSFSASLTEDTRSLPFVAPAMLLAYGEQDKEIISTRNDKAAQAVTVVGRPSFDNVQAIDIYQSRAEVVKALGLDADNKTVLLTTSRLDPDEEDKWLARFLRWAAEETINCIVIKGDRAGLKDYSKLESMAAGKKWGNVHFVTTDQLSAIAASDVVITDKAEAAVEAVLLDKVMVHSQLGEQHDNGIVWEQGIGFEVSSEADLKTIVSGILLDDDFIPEDMINKRAAFKKRFNAENAGNASLKVAQMLLSEDIQNVSFDDPFLEYCIPGYGMSGLKDSIEAANFRF